MFPNGGCSEFGDPVTSSEGCPQIRLCPNNMKLRRGSLQGDALNSWVTLQCVQPAKSGFFSVRAKRFCAHTSTNSGSMCGAWPRRITGGGGSMEDRQGIYE